MRAEDLTDVRYEVDRGLAWITIDRIIDIAPDRLAVFNYAYVPWLKKHQRVIPEDTLPEPAERLRLLKRLAPAAILSANPSGDLRRLGATPLYGRLRYAVVLLWMPRSFPRNSVCLSNKTKTVRSWPMSPRFRGVSLRALRDEKPWRTFARPLKSTLRASTPTTRRYRRRSTKSTWKSLFDPAPLGFWLRSHSRVRANRLPGRSPTWEPHRGSHIVLRHPDPPFRRLVVPNHKSLAKGTLRSLIRESGLTVDEFVALL